MHYHLQIEDDRGALQVLETGSDHAELLVLLRVLQRERDAPETVVAECAARPCPYRHLDDDWVVRAAVWKIATLTATTGVLAAAAMFLVS